MNPILRASHLTKRFSSPVETTLFKDISLEVFPGEIIAIVGKSGEGKTTLLHLLGALEEPSSGEVEIVGEKVSSYNSAWIRNRHIGFVFQSYHLLEESTVLENILMPVRIAKQETRPGSPADLQARHWLEEVGLSHRATFPAKLLSGGEKQRVAIARAFINDPAIILADEPSGNLDRAHSQVMDQLLLEAAQRRGKAVVVVTHDLELASRCQKTYALQDGKLV